MLGGAPDGAAARRSRAPWAEGPTAGDDFDAGSTHDEPAQEPARPEIRMKILRSRHRQPSRAPVAARQIETGALTKNRAESAKPKSTAQPSASRQIDN